MTTNPILGKPTRLKTALLASIAVSVIAAGNAAAAPIACDSVPSPAHKAAIAAADAWQSHHWLRTARRWIATYRLKPAPVMPLGIATFKHAAGLGGEPHGAASPPITGVAVVSRVSCTTYEAGPVSVGAMSADPGLVYIVRYRGRNLTFNENGAGWSRPRPTALIQVLEVRLGATPAAPALVTPMADAPTALPPDAELAPAARAASRGAAKRWK